MPATPLRLTYAGASYFDSTRALERGDIAPSGIELTYLSFDDTSELFGRVAADVPYEASEMSLSTYLLLRGRGDERLVGIPVFPSRSFRHGQIYVHERSGVGSPRDLIGRRVGVPHYQMTSALWIRGALQHDFGVKPRDIQWFEGGLVSPDYKPRIAHEVPGITIGRIPEDRTLEEMLEVGELDALISAQLPARFGQAPISRLFPNYRELEFDYLRRTGIFPIMHLVVLRRDVYERHRWVATALLEAFESARLEARRRVAKLDVLLVMHPWFAEDVAALEKLAGADLFAYGVEPNRKAIEAAIALSHEQGLSARRLGLEDLFAPETQGWRVGS